MDEVQFYDFDKIIPFTLRKSKVRGRFVKLDKSLNGILARHNYNRSISLCLSDALSASCCIGSFLKFNGLLNFHCLYVIRLPAVDLVIFQSQLPKKRYYDEIVIQGSVPRML